MVPVSIDGNGNAIKIVRFSNLNVYTLFITSQIFFKNIYFMWMNMKQKYSLTTRFVFPVALDEQVQVGINLHNLNVIY